MNSIDKNWVDNHIDSNGEDAFLDYKKITSI